jgi:hypothetical protein
MQTRLAVRMISTVFLLAASAACSGSATPTSPSPDRRLVLTGNLVFTDVPVGTTVSATFTIANTGNAPLNIASITGTGALPTQAILSWSSGIIPAGASQEVAVAYRPTVAGSFTGSLIVTGDQTSGANTLGYTATAIPATPFSGTWSGTYAVTDCQGGGSAQAAICGAASSGRPGGAFPVGTSLPISMTLTQDGYAVSGNLALGVVTGAVTGAVDDKGLLTLRGTAAGGPFSAAIVHWSTRVIGTTMDGQAAYAVTMTATPGVGGLVTSLVVTKQ